MRFSFTDFLSHFKVRIEASIARKQVQLHVVWWHSVYSVVGTIRSLVGLYDVIPLWYVYVLFE